MNQELSEIFPITPDLIGADFRYVVDVQDKVERDERARPHDDSDAAFVDDRSVVELLEGVGVTPGRADGVLPLDAVQRGEDCADGIAAEVFGGGFDHGSGDVPFELGMKELDYIQGGAGGLAVGWGDLDLECSTILLGQ